MKQHQRAINILLLHCALFAIVVFIQLFPLIDVIAYGLGAGFLPALLLNSMTFWIILYASARLIPMVWFALPFAIYGGWLAVATYDRIDARRFASAIETNNVPRLRLDEETLFVFAMHLESTAIAFRQYLIEAPVYIHDKKLTLHTDLACEPTKDPHKQILANNIRATPGLEEPHCAIVARAPRPKDHIAVARSSATKRRRADSLWQITFTEHSDAGVQSLGSFTHGDLTYLPLFPWFHLFIAFETIGAKGPEGIIADWHCSSEAKLYVGRAQSQLKSNDPHYSLIAGIAERLGTITRQPMK